MFEVQYCDDMPVNGVESVARAVRIDSEAVTSLPLAVGLARLPLVAVEGENRCITIPPLIWPLLTDRP